MLSRSTRPNGASRGRRSNSNGGLFADATGLIHIRVPHRFKGGPSQKSWRMNLVSLHCERGGRFDVGDITAVPERMNAFATCVRCLGMEQT